MHVVGWHWLSVNRINLDRVNHTDPYHHSEAIIIIIVSIIISPFKWTERRLL